VEAALGCIKVLQEHFLIGHLLEGDSNYFREKDPSLILVWCGRRKQIEQQAKCH